MPYDIDIRKVLFLDIETVPAVQHYDALTENFKALWDRKAGYLKKKEEDTSETLYERAGIYAEFGKIVCISAGFVRAKEARNCFFVKSFYGHDEKQLLMDFAALLNSSFSSPDSLLCAHNGKEFDFPYIARRMLINKIRLPGILNTPGKKPWEVSHLDTMELWKFGDYKSYTSLELLTAVFNIPTPKDDIKGSDVAKVYWEENNLERIAIYCQKDTLSVAQLLLSYQGRELIREEDVIIKND